MRSLISHAGDRAMVRKSMRRRLERPRPGRVAVPGTRERQPFAINDVTPEDAVRMLRSAHYGDLVELNALFDNMFEYDGHLFSVSDSRRLALTGRPWEIVAAEETNQIPEDQQDHADEMVDYCRDAVRRIRGLSAGLNHLQQSVDRGLQIVEVEWGTHPDGEYGPVALHPLLPSQIKQDPQIPGRILIVTPENSNGVPLEDMTPGKFLVMHRYMRKNNPFVSGLMLISLMWHMYTRWGMRWWGSGLERFGLPILIAEYLADADDDEKEEILSILEEMGANGVGIIRKGTEFTMHHAAMGGEWPHAVLMQYADAQKSKLYLGATLTVEQGTVGSHALGQEHQEVKRDRLLEDIALEGEVMSGLLASMVRLRFGPDAWVPCFRRVLEDEQDLGETATWLATVINATGVLPTNGWVAEQFGIGLPEGVDENAPVPGPTMGASLFSDRIPQTERIIAGHVCGDEHVRAHRALEKLSGRRSTVARIIPWIFAAVLASRAHTETALGAVQGVLESSADSQTALARLPGLLTDLPIDDLQAMEWRFLLASELAGRDHVRGQTRTHAEIDFDALPFDEAIKAFRERLLLDPETFLDLEREARSKAWRVAGVWNLDLLTLLHNELAASIEAGETLRDFRQRVPEMAERAGWSGPNPWHSDLVHFQNAVMAFAAGRFREYDVAGVRYWRFVNTGDSCPICEPEIGKVYKVTDTDRVPPLHFFCDCADEPVFDDELEDGELRESDAEENEGLAAERVRRSGFAWDVRQYGALDPIPLAKYPEDLAQVMRRFAADHGFEVTA